MAKSGFYWHVHHDILLEYCYDYDERVEYIKANKPEHEIETRLRLMQPVRGELPAEVVEARRAYDEAWRAYAEAWEARDEAWEALDEAWEAFDEAWRAYDALEAYMKARRVCEKVLIKHKTEIEALHERECGCSEWNGTRLIFD